MPFIRYLLSVLAVLVYIGSAATGQQSSGPFVESDYAQFRGWGSGAIVGTVSGNLRPGAGAPINCNPATSYSKDFIERSTGGERLTPADPRVWTYHRQTVADASGNFEFRGLPQGEYYVYTGIGWGLRGGYGIVVPAGAMASERVTVRPGQKTKVILNH